MGERASLLGSCKPQLQPKRGRGFTAGRSHASCSDLRRAEHPFHLYVGV